MALGQSKWLNYRFIEIFFILMKKNKVWTKLLNINVQNNSIINFLDTCLIYFVRKIKEVFF